MKILTAPFNDNQIKSINQFQIESEFRPFKCETCLTELYAENVGLICIKCDRLIADWAWDWMTDWQWIEMSNSVKKFMNNDKSEFYFRYKKQIKEKSSGLI